MVVPKYWAEARLQDRVGGRSMTVRRFGWSDTSLAEAQAMAERRAAEALEQLRRGVPLPRREPRVPYGGADGVPIREEIVGTHGDCVITPNSYGALCLNTPDVLFVDIDESNRWAYVPLSLAFGVAAIAFWGTRQMDWPIAVGGVLSGLAFVLILWLLGRLYSGPSFEAWGVKRVQSFLAQRPEWHVRVYRTAAGLRVLALHQTFHPLDTEVDEFFRCVGADPTYTRMCRLQRCFRARLTPKPWRVGISKHIRPTHPTAWPVNPTFLPDRQRWIEKCERAIVDYAVCALVAELGSGRVHPKARAVWQLHDSYCRVGTTLPLA
jgi:hypothetical protein